MFPRVLKAIQAAVRANLYEVTNPHFFEALADDEFTIEDAEAVVLTGILTRRFRGDRRGVRYEIIGRTTDGRRAAVVARIKETGTPLFITMYEKSAT